MQDSETYVRMKHKACESVGIVSHSVSMHEASTTEEVIEAVRRYNDSENVDGILVQMPLPAHVDEERVLTQVDITKDVDGFHPLNIGKLAMRNREPTFVPCTPRVRQNLAASTGRPARSVIPDRMCARSGAWILTAALL